MSLALARISQRLTCRICSHTTPWARSGSCLRAVATSGCHQHVSSFALNAARRETRHRPSSSLAAPYKRPLPGLERQLSLEEWRYAVRDLDADKVLSHYAAFAESGQCTRRDTLELTAFFFEYLVFRSGKTALNKAEKKQYARSLAGLYRKGKLQPNPPAETRLLSLFNKLRDFEHGLKFWDWLQKNPGREISPSTYGAAIELLAAADQDASVCEDTFNKALDASPSVFTRYLMSPNAVLSDPSRIIQASGTSVGLLAGIATARFKHGNWREAYLAIDTAFCLHPLELSPSLFQIVLDHRPLEEVLRTFRLFAQSGNRLNPYLVSSLFERLKPPLTADKASKGGHLDPAYQAALIQFSLLRCCILTGQTVTSSALAMLLNSVLRCFPHHNILNEEQRADFHNLAKIVKENFALIQAPLNVKDETIALNMTTVMVAARLTDFKLVNETLNELLPYLPGQLGLIRQILVAALRSGDLPIVRHMTDSLARFSDQSELLSILIKNSRSESELLLCTELVTSLDLPFEQAVQIQSHVQRKAGFLRSLHERPEHVQPDGQSSSERKQAILNMVDQLQEIQALFENPQTGPIESCPPWPTLAPSLDEYPEDWHRRLYHDLHIAPLDQQPISSIEHSVAADSDHAESSWQPAVAGTVTTAGVSIQEIRFQSFRVINDILLLTEAVEKGFALGQLEDPQTSKQSDTSPSLVTPDSLHGSLKFPPQNEEDWRGIVTSLRGV